MSWVQIVLTVGTSFIAGCALGFILSGISRK